MPQIKRQTAYSVWISNLMNASVVKREGAFEPTFLQWNNLEIFRINLVATITNKYESENKTFVSITLDDGSSTIRAKTWREDTHLLSSLKKGDIVRVIGKIRYYNDEIYITPEVVKIVEPNWELVHKLQLLKIRGKPEINVSKPEIKTEAMQHQQIVEEEVVVSESNRQKILALIEKLDKEEGGADREKIKEQSQLQQETINAILEELLKEGEIFEMKGQLKTIS
ncbi:hypothetical protein HYT51_00145 [Candidatus Woesearchaeota archaeon]|nr:hypothetical protein [Candidatus Woesearchaeota archaeon]